MGGNQRLKKKLVYIFAAIFILLAVFFKFALIGYTVVSLLSAGIAICILLFAFLPKKLKIAFAVVLILGMILFLVMEVPIIYAASGTPQFDADYLIVLGAGVNGNTPSLSMVNRLTAAKTYLDEHSNCIAVVSGGMGTGESVTEASAMEQWLISHGVEPSRIIPEPEATSTEENLLFSKALIPDAETANIAVCSSEYHLFRAKTMAELIFEHSVGTVPGKTTYPVLKVNYFIREAFGVLYLKVFGIRVS